MIAETAGRIGLKNVVTMHNDLGIDELVEGTTCYLHSVNSHSTKTKSMVLEGVSPLSNGDLAGGDAETNAEIVRAIFAGEKSPRRDTVVLNSVMGLLITGRFSDLEDAKRACAEAIDSGNAAEKLEAIIATTERLSDA
jgi:anthranilate phosphoribosyltransferase